MLCCLFLLQRYEKRLRVGRLKVGRFENNRISLGVGLFSSEFLVGVGRQLRYIKKVEGGKVLRIVVMLNLFYK
jgi:hypothetical protein